MVVTYLILNTVHGKWRETENIINGDVSSYYGYLPAHFIYKDIGVHNNTYEYEKDKYFFQLSPTVDGKMIFRETCGMAILYAPFFAAAHFTALTFGFHPNGFNDPYLYFLLLSTVFYFLSGMYYLRKLLLFLQYTEFETGITILLLSCGTGLLAYATAFAPMSTIYLFSLITSFVYFSMRWRESKKLSFIIPLGLLFGLSLLITLNGWILLLFHLLYNSDSVKSMGLRLIPLKNFIVFVIFTFIPWVPQFLYWKEVTYVWAIPDFAEERTAWLVTGFLNRLFNEHFLFLVFSPVYLFSIAALFFRFVQPFQQQWTFKVICLIAISYSIVLLVTNDNYSDVQEFLPACAVFFSLPIAQLIRTVFKMHVTRKSFLLISFLWLIYFNVTRVF